VKNSTATSLIHKRDELQKKLKLQREKISQQLGSAAETDEEQFPRSKTMRFLYSTKGLMIAQLIFKQLAGNHSRALGVVKILGQLLLRKSLKN
jgi:hypothetical protein